MELLAPSGSVVERWQGSVTLSGDPVSVPVDWSGRSAGSPGIYRVRMRAVSRDAGPPPTTSEVEEVEQSWEISVGAPAAPNLPHFAPMPVGRDQRADVGTSQIAPAPASLPYTVYFGNLHSQTNHSDGGGDLASCKGAQDPQTGKFGPDAAYAYAREKGLDMLFTSEHNHMYDGSDGTNPNADVGAAKARYQSGLATAASFTKAHHGFLAIYGLEWGVINNGGHLNIFNSPELLGWEKNAKGELVADTLTPRSDYAALYTLMRKRGWIGQFNHPAITGQFIVNGVPLAYTRDGDQVMALCEVLNSTAFSNNDSETETRRSNFEMACNKLLEAGYHVAFSSDQDNHCANWGASYTNRTAVLIPAHKPLTQASFLQAVKARRVFATMDKNSQLVLTANSHIMGERFVNKGPLTLTVHFASSTGKSVASVAVMEGVPGRGGSVSQLSATGVTTITPAPGEHFYYAKVTQNDGNILWSAPVWVRQAAGPKPARKR
ncbi:phosphotransferase [Massilia horti]|uniref:Phosphotransferase n=1 Tax=Massilia horti TaxID=2562153 RepID=A0A4Y9T4S3_9BURK|nr:phosphotransferase [Massilia horti]